MLLKSLLPAFFLAILLLAKAGSPVLDASNRDHENAGPFTAVATADLLDSIGVVSTFPERGQPVDRTIQMVNYAGFRWVRAGIEGLTEDGPTTADTFLKLHRATGARLSWGLGSGGYDLDELLSTARTIAQEGALLAIEGNNEPNNWTVTYRGETGGGLDNSWLPVALLQSELYRRVKSDPVLAGYPVWSISEPGAQTDNVGLQFLEIPPGSDTLMPEGTKFADFANVHNYIYHPHSPQPTDNKVWNAADPSSDSQVDGLFGNFGVTWRNWFRGYGQRDLDALPRVTTETGTPITDTVTEEMQACHLVNLYLAQFKRGYSYTSVYLLRDRTDEGGNQTFGFFRPDYSPRKAGVYLHNLTTILADTGRIGSPGRLDYTIAGQPKTVHDLLLQRSDGIFQIVVWAERLEGEDRIDVDLKRSYHLVEVYDVTSGTRPVRRLTDVRHIALTLSDHPLVIFVSAATDPDAVSVGSMPPSG